jgi:DNA-binding transcriptional LysR family regulator
MPFDLDVLRTFVMIVDAGGFTRAGERLGRTQSTISLQMKRLEEALGRQIIQRGARGIALTADGDLFLSYARRILGLADEARSRLMDSEVEGTVRLGTPEDFATVHLPGVLARFARSHPKVTLDVRCDFTLNLLDAFGKGEFDLVLFKREPQGPSGGVRVWREPLVWAAGGRAMHHSEGPVRLVLSPPPCVYRKRAIQALEAENRDWQVVYTSPSLAGVQAAVQAGLGATVLPREMVPSSLEVIGPEQGFPALEDTEIALYKAAGNRSKAVERLAEYIVRSLEDEQEAGQTLP